MLLRVALVGGTVATAALATVVGLAALNSGKSPPAAAKPSPSATTASRPSEADPIVAKAQSLADTLLSHGGAPAAAAFVTTTYAAFGASLPDAVGIQGSPSPSDRVILVKVEGYFPATHGCYYSGPNRPCFDTGILVAYDVNLNQTIDTAWENDPWSPDRPSPAPSVSERFNDLRQWGTPVALLLSK